MFQNRAQSHHSEEIEVRLSGGTAIFGNFLSQPCSEVRQRGVSKGPWFLSPGVRCFGPELPVLACSLRRETPTFLLLPRCTPGLLNFGPTYWWGKFNSSPQWAFGLHVLGSSKDPTLRRGNSADGPLLPHTMPPHIAMIHHGVSCTPAQSRDTSPGQGHVLTTFMYPFLGQIAV